MHPPTASARYPSKEAPVAPAPAFDIDRSSPTPLYFQLAQAIEGAITGGDLTEHGLYNYLRAQGVHLRVAHQRIGARLARAEEARLLDEAPGSALLTVQRTAFDDQGTAIEYGRQVYRASRYDVETTLVGR
jgi:DNA-binding GntR family transcriptional regulator